MKARPLIPLLGIAAVVILVSCERAERAADEEPHDTLSTSVGAVTVIARDYSFEAPARIPSGWTTFRMSNEGREHHFLLLTRLPEGKTIDDYGKDVGSAFSVAWDSLQAGVDKATVAGMLGALLPEWYAAAVTMGGPGLLAPGGVSRTTVKLEPGHYVMECYVKTADGRFHIALGMARPLTVTRDPSEGAPPEPDVEVTLSNGAIAVAGSVKAGEQTVGVHFAEQPGFGLGNDVHVARLEPDTDLRKVFRWMDWMEIDGLRAPAPATFIGGAEEMPVGETAYFTVNLTPGRYAWVSESTAEDMISEFSVE